MPLVFEQFQRFCTILRGDAGRSARYSDRSQHNRRGL